MGGGAEARGNGTPAGRAFLAQQVRECAPVVAERFRQQLTGWPGRGVWRNPMLADVIEPFLRRLGEQLAAEAPDRTAPWAQCTGVLRLAPTRGPGALIEEVAVLRRYLRELVGTPEDADDPKAARFAEAAIDVLCDGALAELSRLAGRNPPAGPPRFGGVVVEIFERPVPNPWREADRIMAAPD